MDHLYTLPDSCIRSVFTVTMRGVIHFNGIGKWLRDGRRRENQLEETTARCEEVPPYPPFEIASVVVSRSWWSP